MPQTDIASPPIAGRAPPFNQTGVLERGKVEGEVAEGDSQLLRQVSRGAVAQIEGLHHSEAVRLAEGMVHCGAAPISIRWRHHFNDT